VTAVAVKIAAKALPHILVTLESQLPRSYEVPIDHWLLDRDDHGYSLPQTGEGNTLVKVSLQRAFSADVQGNAMGSTAQ